MNQLFLITGGNIGDRKKNLENAAALIYDRIGTVVKSSKIYETEAWGLTDQPAFYNQVHVVESNFSAKEVLSNILQIEEEMGRKRTIKNAARIIDIDILFFNEEIVNEQNLVIPHPQISNRRFVLLPLSELVPQMIHPVFKKSIHQLLLQTKDQLKVTAVV
ncbi:MAG: 2-amino-4-hydroxy-6-hydroxymethyldihydropteridine diphosphokinase [Bacteroidota bacterium]|nr:2-amino-4-hydroxy-6-hydroxymethyldihydropteridine diphosphokinase [Bacteroidota bacterium]